MASNSSSNGLMTPRNRRMTLSTLPQSGLNNGGMHTGSNRNPLVEPSASAGVGVPKSNIRRPPKGRVSMIPRVGGRENAIPTGSNSGAAAGSSSNTPRGPAPYPSSFKNPSHSHRRSSIGGDELSKIPSGISRNRRQSVGPSSNEGFGTSNVGSSAVKHVMQGPSTTATANGNSYGSASAGQKPDPRPINDKAFQQTCIRELLSFLFESGYAYPVSTKSLARPSAKDFTNIVTFMLRMVDPDFQRDVMKFEDEVVLNFKQMGYPYAISKTALVAAGSLHTWPTLLAALSWLMNQIQCKNERLIHDLLDGFTESSFETLEALEKQTESAFFQYLHRSYVSYMLGNDSDLTMLETTFSQKFDHDDNFLQDAVSRVTDENASLVHDINEIAEQFEDLAQRAQKREEYENDLKTFHDLVRQMDERKTTLEKEVRDQTAQLAENNGKIESLSTHVNELKQAIKDQEFSVDDIHKLEGELKGLSEACDRAYAMRDQLRKGILVCETDLVNVCNDLDSMTAEYNGLVSELQLVPELGSRFSGMKIEPIFRDNLLHSDQLKILGVDLSGKVQVSAASAKTEYSGMIGTAKTSYQSYGVQTSLVDAGCKEADAKLKIVSDKRLKSEHILETERIALCAKVAVHEREVDAMETKIAALQDPIALEEQMAGFQRQCAELEALRLERQAEQEARFRAVASEVQEACELMSDHAAFVKGKIVEVNAYWHAKADELNDVLSPTNV